MRTFIKRLSAVLLAATVFALVACDNGGGASDRGGGAQIAAERYTFEAKSYCIDDAETGHVMEHVYDSSFFDRRTDVFSKDLALFCLTADMANYQERTIVDFFAAARFDNVATYNYGAEDESYTPAMAIAHKKAGANDIVFLSFRGTSYGKGWLGNFDVGREGEWHRGFYLAAANAYDELKTYLDGGDYEKETLKVVVTGHSRGASIADVLGKLIDDDGEYALTTAENVYVYAFSGSACAEKSKTEAANVFNVIMRDDLLTLVFPHEYGLYRVGTDIDVFRPDYATLVREIFGDGVSTFVSPLYGNALQAYSALIGAMVKDVDREKYPSLCTRADFVDNLQDAIGKATMFTYFYDWEKKAEFFAYLKEYASDMVSGIMSDKEALYKAVKASSDKAEFTYDDDEMRYVCDKLQSVIVSMLINDPISAATALKTVMNNFGYIPSMHRVETIYAALLYYEG